MRLYHPCASMTWNQFTGIFKHMYRFSLPEPSIDGTPFNPAEAVLTQKNVMTMKDLLVLVHSAGGILGPSWRIVMESLEQLYLMIQCQRSKVLMLLVPSLWLMMIGVVV